MKVVRSQMTSKSDSQDGPWQVRTAIGVDPSLGYRTRRAVVPPDRTLGVEHIARSRIVVVDNAGATRLCRLPIRAFVRSICVSKSDVALQKR